MRVGIVTFHCSYNFGSALQAYALREQLKSLGHEAQIIDYRSRNYRFYKLFRFARPKDMFNNLLTLRKNILRRHSFERFIFEVLSPTARSYSYKNEKNMTELADSFDCFVCGSDQIWNLDCTGGPVGPFFLDFAGDKRRVAYAPSLAHTSFNPNNYTELIKRYIGEQLDRFYAISVRELSTVPIFQSLTSNEIDVCLDPTLLLNGEEYKAIVSKAPIEGSFIFAYMLEESPSVIEQAERVAKEFGDRIVYVAPTNLTLNVPSINLYGIGPSEFLDLVARADAVITNSFHATVFSLLMGTPFQTISTKLSGSRMEDLLESLGEADHLISHPTNELPVAANPAAFMPKLESLRAHSLAFLYRALAD